MKAYAISCQIIVSTYLKFRQTFGLEALANLRASI